MLPSRFVSGHFLSSIQRIKASCSLSHFVQVTQRGFRACQYHQLCPHLGQTVTIKNSDTMLKIERIPFCHNVRMSSGRAGKDTQAATLKSSPIEDAPPKEYTLLYRLPAIVTIRMISRFKILQTGMTIVILAPMSLMYWAGKIGPEVLGFSVGVMTLAGVMLYVISGLSRRVVGLINVNKSLSVAKISHLTFWGKRADIYMDVKDIVPISDFEEDDVYVKLKTYSGGEDMILFLKWGNILDKEKLEKVIGKL